MKAECADCGIVKRGCKIVNWTLPGWKHILGEPVCRCCLNFERRYPTDKGPNYDVRSEVKKE